MVMYGTAAALVGRLPKDSPNRTHGDAHSSWTRAKLELKEGARFVVGRSTVFAAMINLTLIASLVMIMAMLAPGIASRVLHLAPEDAIVVFAPAGVGMLVSALVLGRWGERIHKQRLGRWGLACLAVGFALFGALAWEFQATNQRLALDPSTVLHMAPAGAALILASVLLSFVLGLSASGVNITSQTVLQENTPEQLRGRVFSVQFMLNNLVGIPPMLAIGAMADWLGIPAVLVGVSLLVLAVLSMVIRIQNRGARTHETSENTGAVASMDMPLADEGYRVDPSSEPAILPRAPTPSTETP